MWKPIETAPKDGTPIIACGDYDDDFGIENHPRTVVFKTYHPNAPGKGTWRNHLGHKENHLTHWVEVPESPDK